jgi:hypothetical protein
VSQIPDPGRSPRESLRPALRPRRTFLIRLARPICWPEPSRLRCGRRAAQPCLRRSGVFQWSKEWGPPKSRVITGGTGALRQLMRRLATWLVLATVGAVVFAGVVDGVRRSSADSESADGVGSTAERSTTTGPRSPSTTAGVVTTEAEGTTAPANKSTAPATTEAEAKTAPASKSTAPERLASCTTPQLKLAFTFWEEGLAALVLRRVAGKACHHNRSPIRFTVHDQSGHRVTVFGGAREQGFTTPADFSHGFEQLIQFPNMSCDPAGSFLVVARVGPYTARQTFPGRNLVCSHS